MGPCSCLAIINLVPLIGACLGFKVLSKSCDCSQQYTHIMLFRFLLTHRVANTLRVVRMGDADWPQVHMLVIDSVQALAVTDR